MKLKYFKSMLLINVCLATQTFAQESLIEEVVVTATKRAQTLQEVPVAVTVTSAETIEQAQIKDILDLQSVVPSLRVEQRQSARATNFVIRGFGGGSNNLGLEASVAVFVDGVYRSRSAAAISDLPRLERVEVLGGPQSTLFGKNASAGVVSVVTPKPTGESGGFVELGAGNYGALTLKGLYEGALSENLNFEISANSNTRDGYVENPVTGVDINERDRFGVRGQLVYTPTDSTELRLIADYGEIDEQCCYVNNLAPSAVFGLIPLFGAAPVVDDPFARRQNADITPRATIENSGISAQLSIDYDTFSLTSITALRNTSNFDVIDTDQTALNLIGAGTNDIEIDTFSQEIRLTSTGGGDFEWLVGGFFFDESIDTINVIRYGPDFRPFFGSLVGGEELLGLLEAVFVLPSGSIFGNGRGEDIRFSQDNQSLSLFGQADWHINDNLTATLGLNYTDDEKEVSYVQMNDDVFSAASLAGTPFAGLGGLQFLRPLPQYPNTVESGQTNDDDVTYTLRLAYQVTDATNVYLSYGTGFKASSFNIDRGTRPLPGDIPRLEAAGLSVPNLFAGTRFALPEESEVVEFGLKTKFERGALNLAVFEQSIENFQTFLFTDGARFVLANADKQSTKGFEFDLTYYPLDALQLRFSGTLLDPVYDSFPDGQGPNGPEDLSGRTPAAIHETSLSIGAVYNFQAADGWMGFVRGDYQYEDEIQVAENVTAEIASREVKQANFATGVVSDNGLAISAWVRNATDEEYVQGAFPDVLFGASGAVNGYPNQPRTYGITLRKDF